MEVFTYQTDEWANVGDGHGCSHRSNYQNCSYRIFGQIFLAFWEVAAHIFPNDFHWYVELQGVCEENGNGDGQFNGLSRSVGEEKDCLILV